MPIRGSPNGANHLRPQAGRDRLEQVVAINRNAWSQSIGTAGRNHPVRAQQASQHPRAGERELMAGCVAPLRPPGPNTSAAPALELRFP
jgi:hypothetical protein